MKNSESIDFQDFSPASLMRVRELSKSLRMHVEVRDARSKATAAWMKSTGKARPDLDAKFVKMEREVTEVCAAVLLRELGLEQFMVIRISRPNDSVELMQLLEADLGYHNSWMLSGRVVRKDGTLGASDTSIAVNWAYIEFRKLDGTWETVSRVSKRK